MSRERVSGRAYVHARAWQRPEALRPAAHGNVSGEGLFCNGHSLPGL